MRHSSGMLKFTWVALAAVVATLLTAPPLAEQLSPASRVWWWPAARGLEALTRLDPGHFSPTQFPLMAAAQVLLLGVVLDASRRWFSLSRSPRTSPGRG